MKKLLFILMLLPAIYAAAQTPTVTTPQSVTNATLFNAVSAATTSGCISNLGQTVHQATYIVTGSATAIQFRLEYSFNSDPATCTTGTWFQLSDDATDLVQGQVIGIGAYPFIRANLVACVGCSPGTVTLRASYTGTSSIPGNAYGFYNPSQQIRKALFVAQALGTGLTILGVPAPYGSASGFIIFNSNSSLPANSSIQIIIHYGNLQAVTVTFAIPNAFAGGTLSVSEPSIPATSVDVVVNDGGVSSNRTISAYYFFYPPGQLVPGVQPISWIGESAATFNMLSSNQEIVSALNTAVSIDLDVSATATAKTQRASLFKVSARCSAGSAQLTVTDGGTTNTLAGSGNGQIYSTAATEVGTTTFRESWNPGLSSSPSTGLHITLGTCGAGNAGTLDVQGSVF